MKNKGFGSEDAELETSADKENSRWRREFTLKDWQTDSLSASERRRVNRYRVANHPTAEVVVRPFYRLKRSILKTFIEIAARPVDPAISGFANWRQLRFLKRDCEESVVNFGQTIAADHPIAHSVWRRCDEFSRRRPYEWLNQRHPEVRPQSAAPNRIQALPWVAPNFRPKSIVISNEFTGASWLDNWAASCGPPTSGCNCATCNLTLD